MTQRSMTEEEAFRYALDAQARDAADYVSISNGDPVAIDRFFTAHCALLARERDRARNTLWGEITENNAKYAQEARALREGQKAS